MPPSITHGLEIWQSIPGAVRTQLTSCGGFWVFEKWEDVASLTTTDFPEAQTNISKGILDKCKTSDFIASNFGFGPNLQTQKLWRSSGDVQQTNFCPSLAPRTPLVLKYSMCLQWVHKSATAHLWVDVEEGGVLPKEIGRSGDSFGTNSPVRLFTLLQHGMHAGARRDSLNISHVTAWRVYTEWRTPACAQLCLAETVAGEIEDYGDLNNFSVQPSWAEKDLGTLRMLNLCYNSGRPQWLSLQSVGTDGKVKSENITWPFFPKCGH